MLAWKCLVHSTNITLLHVSIANVSIANVNYTDGHKHLQTIADMYQFSCSVKAVMKKRAAVSIP